MRFDCALTSPRFYPTNKRKRRMEIKDGGIVVINGDNIEAGGMKIVHHHGGGNGDAPKGNEPLTEEQLRGKVERAMPFITTKRLWFPVCKYMMWRGMVAEGDFKTAVDKLNASFPILVLMPKTSQR